MHRINCHLRPITTYLFLAAMCPMANSQVLLSPALSEKATASEAATPVVVKIHASSEPDPPLRLRFWPAPEDQRNVNAMPFVNRAVLMTVQSMQNTKARRDFADKEHEWRQLPLNGLPKEEARKLLNRYGTNSIGELERAENFMQVDYDLRFEDMSAAEIIRTLLPEFQEMRSVARLCSLRARLAASEGRWDDFTRDCRLNFRLSEAAGRSSDFLVGRLVGFAIAGVTMANVEEAMQQPDAPSFYWALASLPEERLFETQRSIEFESVTLSRLLDKNAFTDEPIGAEAARAMVRQLAKDAQELFGTLENLKETQSAGFQFMSGVYVVAAADSARAILEETPNWKGRTEQLSASEAVLRSTYLKLARARDKWVKWSLLPPELAKEYEKEIDDAMKQPSAMDIPSVLAHQLTPAIHAASRAGLRSRQHRNLLLTIEALRMHAGQTGELPKTLNKLRPVPAWHDSMTTKPFGYVRTSPIRATVVTEPSYPGDDTTIYHIHLQTKDQK